MLGKKKQKPRRTPGHFDTLISGKTTVEGDVHFSGGLHVDGTIKGRVVAEEGSDAVVRLSEVGEIVGDVVAPHIIINGKVKGDVHASAHLELAEKAVVTGNVYYQLIEMAMGASVNGNLVRKDETSGLLTHEQKQPESSIAGEDEDKSE
ncbi:bactofilin family protein [Marinobacter nauticus]|uniref:bactofilin family protein n=1 Tax=Marinobacter nauticus TaxID=2743 RepID=UPI001C990EA8|nr:polymer-forming cytoskeletal protein [Marinobacter nauticus]MBY5939132.1 polymer-forming cytoskeletal protein [Marinobacter nauticus]MBY5956327.1 polymer-forming cytoskeletal protein [Marinobacter nauticus]MBY6010118.1 polymer-forming cytoskeletal protein [Marinobacter nauticus]